MTDKANAVYASVFELSRTPMTLVSVDETILNANSAFLQTFGIERSAILGQPFSVLLEEFEFLTIPQDCGYLSLVHEFDSLVHHIHVRHHVDGSLVHCRMTMTMIRDPQTGFGLYALFEFLPYAELIPTADFLREHHRMHICKLRAVLDPVSGIPRYVAVPQSFQSMTDRPFTQPLMNTLRIVLYENPRPLMYIVANEDMEIEWANRSARDFFTIGAQEDVIGRSMDTLKGFMDAGLKRPLQRLFAENAPHFILYSKPLLNLSTGLRFRLFMNGLGAHMADNPSHRIYYVSFRVTPVDHVRLPEEFILNNASALAANSDYYLALERAKDRVVMEDDNASLSSKHSDSDTASIASTDVDVHLDIPESLLNELHYLEDMARRYVKK
jgi:PAS domain S-box-containing protein